MVATMSYHAWNFSRAALNHGLLLHSGCASNEARRFFAMREKRRNMEEKNISCASHEAVALPSKSTGLPVAAS